MNEPVFDVGIVGGGLAGLAFATMLGQRLPAASRWRLALVEPAPPVAVPDDAPIGLRVVAVSPASAGLLEECAAWETLPPLAVSPYERMCVWQGYGPPGESDSIRFEAAEFGIPALGYIVDHDCLRARLWSQLPSRVERVSGHRGVGVRREADAATLLLDDGGALIARLLVGADGLDSEVRRALGLAPAQRSYGQQAIVAHVASERPHERTAWQRFLPGGPLALLPLADGRSSIVWSCRNAEAASLLALDEEAFGERLTRASAGVLGRLRLTSSRAAFPLAAAHARRYTGARFALIGDAAHRIHPLAGQGINLGFLDADALAAALVAHQGRSRWADPGDELALRKFERARKGANLVTQGFMDVLHALFTSETPMVTAVAARGLGLTDRLGPVKRWLGRSAMGPGPHR